MNAVVWTNVRIAKKRPVFLVLGVVTSLSIYLVLSSSINDAVLFCLSVPTVVLISESIKTFNEDPFRGSLEMLYATPESTDIHGKFNVARTLLCSAAYGVVLFANRIFCQNRITVEDSVTGVSILVFTVFVSLLTVTNIKKMPGLCRSGLFALLALQLVIAAFVAYVGFYAFHRYSLVIVSVALLCSVMLVWFVTRRGCSVEKAMVRSIQS